MNLPSLYIKELVVVAIREYFAAQKYHEVITPVLHHALPLEPNLYSFATSLDFVDTSTPLYLATSPESALKKLLAEGIGNCYAIGHSFRNNEFAGTQHNPEFLMLEWYQENATYRDVMEVVQALLEYISKKLGKNTVWNWQTLSLNDLFAKYVGASLSDVLVDDALPTLAAKLGYNTREATWGELFDQIFCNEIEPHLPKSPFFLVDFPARVSPLCKSQTDNPLFAERFEVYVAGMELGNGNTEQCDAAMVRKSFEQEQQFRLDHKLPTHPIDEDFLQALEQLAQTKKSYAGIGLGIDRLSMALTGQTNIIDFLSV